MRQPPSELKPLRLELLEAMEQRIRTLENGWCRRTDYADIEQSIRRAQDFLYSYPVASDERVSKWCRDHHKDIGRIVIGTNHRRLQRLMMSALEAEGPVKPRPNAVVIELNTKNTPAA